MHAAHARTHSGASPTTENSYSKLVDEEANVDEEEDGEEKEEEMEEEIEEEKRILHHLEQLERKQHKAKTKLRNIEMLMAARTRPLTEELHDIHGQVEQLQEELRTVRERREKGDEATPPGPAALAFVGSHQFGHLCSAIVLGNLVCMVLVMRGTGKGSSVPFVMDQLFLMWYLGELLVKATYYQRSLLFGKLSIVWWNWLDLGIVISGVIDQWLMPLISSHMSFDTKTLRFLRFLRLFRLARLLKILRSLIYEELSWVEDRPFESFIMCVILFNALVMGMELDFHGWGGWVWLNHIFLIIYTFEVVAKLRHLGRQYFTRMFHWLDITIVLIAMVEQWLLPFVQLVEEVVVGHSQSFDNPLVHSTLSLLRMARLLRIFRLASLVKHIRPLYRFGIGMQAGIDGMKWVMVLTVLFLYCGAIIFTNLVGHGLLFGGPENVPEDALERYGTVTQSMFSLFKLMNDDQSVVNAITTSMAGKFLFVFFMVGTNWVILATLTSVLADHMIAASSQILEKDRSEEMAQDYHDRSRRLRSCFAEHDPDSTGTIGMDDFHALLTDPDLCKEICSASSLKVSELKDLFFLLCDEFKNIEYSDFIHICYEQREGADKRAILTMMAYMRDLERRLDYRLDSLGAAPHLPRGNAIRHFLDPE